MSQALACNTTDVACVRMTLISKLPRPSRDWLASLSEVILLEQLQCCEECSCDYFTLHDELRRLSSGVAPFTSGLLTVQWTQRLGFEGGILYSA